MGGGGGKEGYQRGILSSGTYGFSTGKKEKRNKYTYQQFKDLRRRRVRSLERFKDSPEVFYSPQLVPLAHVLSDVSLNNVAIQHFQGLFLTLSLSKVSNVRLLPFAFEVNK